ncbi:ABC transporter ATP-binding protein [Lactococcus lactis subsp. lactis]|uniref:ABC transporter ATP-binding protein n=1 Tax=Lactococcus lactis TaxID=1358 RepID=UPI001BA68FDC|nr:ABC transporter ATP-binding protein [Lactococcus lactis]MDT3324203.1 ABC transporter ATP-binding protein [Bacillota bacterium]MBR8678403.1 ATP-binding cassette domain-containing protein [Lactococcus lactis subsp. lactis]MBR8681170.1 ATP-binding cassette domain-containing protein [Lactococcus lactis subsp. lactis]MBR8686294.1 ATP-binding cassette domain-containing protein [Lactococcus lactis subsp. lactis]MBS3729385.1 ABC transporter ATP-binding protein [Lactococcus lactis subsp. lactis]
MDKLVEVKGLQKNFGQFQALKDVSFEVNAGEVLGYIGPNGAGKSTTIRILLGIIRATQGKVQIFGKDVWQDSIEVHKKIVYVPGDVYLWPNLSGGETIDLFLKLHGAINQEKRDQLIKKFDLNPKKKVRSYSKGNRQKIALIAALATEAELYIFDEPTSGLDPLMEAVFQEEVKGLKAAGKAIILSSHILSEVEKLADRVAVIRKGEIVETGTLDDLRHLTRYQYKVETEQEAVGLKELSSVHDLQIKENEATFQADSDAIDEILKTLLLYGVKKLEATPPTLEDLFMRHYQ